MGRQELFLKTPPQQGEVPAGRRGSLDNKEKSCAARTYIFIFVYLQNKAESLRLAVGLCPLGLIA
jgi:hypothetical protein